MYSGAASWAVVHAAKFSRGAAGARSNPHLSFPRKAGIHPPRVSAAKEFLCASAFSAAPREIDDVQPSSHN